jgi:N-acyl-D-aspartate/D-glutamate deacylase
MLDTLITGGTVIDGTGAPRRRADVGIRDGRVVAVAEPGTVDEPAATTVDATDLVVSPGFVDLHTHYDAQLFWDPTASPSSLHGVTTIIGGNCGFTLAPCGPEHADYLMRMMARVEGMPLPALEAGLSWDWSSFADWLGRLEGNTAVNAGFLVGHSALRRVVLGDAAHEAASDEQVAQMSVLLEQALAAGALGFSSSQAHTHKDGAGDPVPSRGASHQELIELASAVRAHPGTTLELIVAGSLDGFRDDEVDLMAAMSVAAQRPLNWNALGVSAADPEGWRRQLKASDVAADRGGEVIALVMPHSLRTRMSFLTGFVLDALPGWGPVIGLPVEERIVALRDPEVRRRLDQSAHSPEAGGLQRLADWVNLEVLETFAPENKKYEDRFVGDIARETGRDPFDVLLDIVCADELRTGLGRRAFGDDDATWAERATAWLDPRTIVGASDAGAHLDMMCGAIYSTSLVGPAVRDRELLSLEEAVRQLTTIPAALYGLVDRGQLAEGAYADVVVFDPATVGYQPERTRHDLPGGAPRLYAESTGIEHVLVNGVEIVRSGAATGAIPGAILHSGRDTRTVTPGSRHGGSQEGAQP